MKNIRLTLKENSTTPTFSLDTRDTTIGGKIEDLVTISEDNKKKQMFLVWNLVSKPIELEIIPSTWNYEDSLQLVLDFYNLRGEIIKKKDNEEALFRLFI